MKKLSLLCFVLLAAFALQAQEKMTQVWTNKLGHKTYFKGTGLEGEYSYAADQKEITFFDNSTGNAIWSNKFAELAPKLKKIDELIPFWESECVFLFDRKLGKDQLAVVDMKTGQLLWSTDKYQNLSEENIVYIAEEEGFAISLKTELVFVKAKSGEELWTTSKFKGVVGQYVYSDGNLTTVNFVPSSLGALFTGFKNQIARINMKNGDIVWEATYIGRAERKAVTRDFIFDMKKDGDKIFLLMNGIQVYDYNTGAQLWSAAFDYTPDQVVRRPSDARRFGVYGAVADPVFIGNDVYVLDMSNKRNQFIKKYDRNTGKLLWTSPEIKGGAKAIPAMNIVDGKVVLQIGGIVEAQAYIVKSTSEGTTYEYRVWYPNVKPNGIQAFDANNGSFAWKSEKFKKGITNSYVYDGKLIVSSGKTLYSMNVADGNVNYEVPVKKGGVGNASQILSFNDKIIVVGQKGVSSFNVADGNLVGKGKYKKSTLQSQHGDILVMNTGKRKFAAFDLNTCKFKTYAARKGSTTTLSKDGKFVYVYEKKTVTKVKTL